MPDEMTRRISQQSRRKWRAHSQENMRTMPTMTATAVRWILEQRWVFCKNATQNNLFLEFYFSLVFESVIAIYFCQPYLYYLVSWVPIIIALLGYMRIAYRRWAQGRRMRSHHRSERPWSDLYGQWMRSLGHSGIHNRTAAYGYFCIWTVTFYLILDQSYSRTDHVPVNWMAAYQWRHLGDWHCRIWRLLVSIIIMLSVLRSNFKWGESWNFASWNLMGLQACLADGRSNSGNAGCVIQAASNMNGTRLEHHQHCNSYWLLCCWFKHWRISVKVTPSIIRHLDR